MAALSARCFNASLRPRSTNLFLNDTKPSSAKTIRARCITHWRAHPFRHTRARFRPLTRGTPSATLICSRSTMSSCAIRMTARLPTSKPINDVSSLHYVIGRLTAAEFQTEDMIFEPICAFTTPSLTYMHALWKSLGRSRARSARLLQRCGRTSTGFQQRMKQPECSSLLRTIACSSAKPKA